jgi:hypothetical protein
MADVSQPALSPAILASMRVKPFVAFALSATDGTVTINDGFCACCGGAPPCVCPACAPDGLTQHVFFMEITFSFCGGGSLVVTVPVNDSGNPGCGWLNNDTTVNLDCFEPFGGIIPIQLLCSFACYSDGTIGWGVTGVNNK